MKIQYANDAINYQKLTVIGVKDTWKEGIWNSTKYVLVVDDGCRQVLLSFMNQTQRQNKFFKKKHTDKTTVLFHFDSREEDSLVAENGTI